MQRVQTIGNRCRRSRPSARSYTNYSSATQVVGPVLPHAKGTKRFRMPKKCPLCGADIVKHLLLLASRMSPKQLATSKRKPKSDKAKGYVDGSIARSHVSTARVLKQAAGKRP